MGWTGSAGVPGWIRRRVWTVAVVTGLTFPAAACGDDPIIELPPPAGGVDLEALFSVPTTAEVEAIEAEWRGRVPQAVDVRSELTAPYALGSADGTLTVYSHAIAGGRHYGAVLAPNGAAPGSLPVLVYLHGGDAGVDLDELALLVPTLGESAERFVFAVPSFRAEPLVAEGRTFDSGGEASPWDRDVDDAMAFLDVTLASTPAADRDRVGVLGFSRGAGVGLLMGVREPRVDRVVAFFGPTDFFDGFVQAVVAEALEGRLQDLPGLATLHERFLEPLAEGVLDIDDVRPELVRRSAVLFADRLPPVQVHHGTDDPIVAVSQAQSLSAAFAVLGLGAPDHVVFLYPGGGHHPLSLPGSLPRATDFLAPLIED